MVRPSSSSSSQRPALGVAKANSAKNNDDGSIGGSLASPNSRASNGSRRSISSRRRGSFAAATASSLARGGPSTNAPHPKKGNSAPIPKGIPRSISTTKTTGERKIGNAENSSNSNAGEVLTPKKTPMKGKKKGSATKNGDAPVLSPTPYWKVKAERKERGDDYSTPPKTRSAAKKDKESAIQQAMERRKAAEGSKKNIMEMLDAIEDEEEDKNDNDSVSTLGDEAMVMPEGYDPSYGVMMEFSPPTAKHHKMAAKKQKEAELEKEKVRKSSIRNARQAGLVLATGSFDKGKGYEDSEASSLAMATTPQKKHALKAKRMRTKLAQSDSRSNVEYDFEQQQLYMQRMQMFQADEMKKSILEAVQTVLQSQQQQRQQSGSNQEVNNVIEQLQQILASANSEKYSTDVAEMAQLRARIQEMEKIKENYEDDRTQWHQKEQGWHAKETKWKAQQSAWEVKEAEGKKMEAERKAEEERKKVEWDECKEENKKLKEMEKEQWVMLSKEQEELRKCKESKRALEEEKKQMQENLSSAENETDELKRVKASLENKIQTMEGIRIADGGKMESLQTKVEEWTTKISTLEQQLIDANFSHQEELEAVQRDHEEKIKQLQETANQEKMSIQSANESTILEMEKQMEEMQSPRSAKAVQEEVLELKSKMDRLTNDLFQNEEEKTALRVEVDNVRKDNEALIKELEGARSSVDELSAKNQELSSQLESSHSRLKEKGHELEEIAAENESLLSKLQSAESDLDLKANDMDACARRELELQDSLESATKERDDTALQLSQLQQDHTQLKDYNDNLKEQLNQSEKKLTELTDELQIITNHLQTAKSKITSLEQQLQEKQTRIVHFEAIERKLLHEKNILNEIRRKLHDRVMQLSGNMRVFVRVRPLIMNEKMLLEEHQEKENAKNRRVSLAVSRPSSRHSSRGSPSSGEDDPATNESPFEFFNITDRNTDSSSNNNSSANDLTKQMIRLTEPYKDRGGLKERRKKWTYGFDGVFPPTKSQSDVWEAAEPLVQSSIDGFPVCMFAYGQTGSGKTHTMIGDAENPGLIPRAVHKLFSAKKEIETMSKGQVTVDINIELLEIYNEDVRDLLATDCGPNGQLLKLKLNSNEAVGNNLVKAYGEDDVAGVLKLAQSRRCVKATKSNSESSRSHLLFTIHFDVSSFTEEGKNRSGILHIVDLAGSERLDKSGSHGAMLKEAQHINTSLSALSLVIEKLQAKSDHIPYRDSKLTYLLRNSLGGNSKTLAIVCCSPHQLHFNETLSSIKFAVKASKVELKEASSFSA